MDRVSGKSAMITGGAHGLGEGMCYRLAEEGAAIAIADIDIDGARYVAEKIVSQGGRALAYKLNVSQATEWPPVMESIQNELGALDILVNNAGKGILGSIEDTSIEQWRDIMNVNLDGVFLGTKFAVAAMKMAKSGSIINISSIRGMVGDPLSIAYDSSKGGVRMLTKSAALHCAVQKYGIRVNSVHPGYVLTDMFKDATAHLPDADDLLAQVTAAHPIGRLGTVQDVANAVLYLASDESAFVTGAELVVDGGYTAQ